MKATVILPSLAILAAALFAACSADTAGPNRPPVALAGLDRTAVVDEVLLLDGRASYDPDGDDLSWSWNIVSAPADATAALGDADTALASLRPDRAGRYTLRLVVDDGRLFSEPDVVQVLAGGGCQNDQDCSNDDLWCNGQEVCTDGICVFEPQDCDDGDPCTQNLCDEDNDACQHPPVSDPPAQEGPDGDPSCSDLQDNDCDGLTDAEDPACRPCDQDDECDDDNPCTSDRCEAQGCVNEALADGSVCDDGLSCTESDVCASGQCHGTEKDCSGLDEACRRGVCIEPDGDCTTEPRPLATPCEDGLFCTSGDGCDDAGTCQGGSGSPCPESCLGTCNEDQDRCDPDPSGTACPDDGFSCTQNETCDGAGHCVGDGSGDLNCPSGQLCRPACFGGPSGCGLPPATMALTCDPDRININSDPASDCTISLDGMGGQEACLACQARSGTITLFNTDFADDQNASQCSLDGWTLIAGPYCHNGGTACPMTGLGSRNCCTNFRCPISTGGLQNYLAFEANKADCGDEQWRLRRTVNLIDMQNAEFCFQYASNAATNNEAIQVRFSDIWGHLEANAFCDLEGPREEIDDRWYRVCVDLPPWADDNPHVNIDLFIQSNDNDDRIFVDDLTLRALWLACPATREIFISENFAGCTDPGADLSAWTVGGDLACATGFDCPDGSTRLRADHASGAIERRVDTSAFEDLLLCFHYGDHNADTGERLLVEFDASGDGSAWWPAWSQAGNAGPNDSCARICVNLSELDRAVDHNPSLGLRFTLESDGGGQILDLDEISLLGARTCDASTAMDLGAIADQGGGEYAFQATSLGEAFGVGLQCSWDSPPPGLTVADKTRLRYRDWWDEAWDRRIRLSFRNAGQDEDLQDFPVLVRLDAGRIDYSLTDGDDLRFIDADGQILAYEIERWDEAGVSEIWVRVPQIDRSSRTDHVWLYYHHPGAPPGENPSQVWAPDHRAVWHLQGGLTDSSGNGNDCTDQGTIAAEGQIASGREFDGSGYADCGDGQAFEITDEITVEAWVQVAELGGKHHPIVTKGDFTWGLKVSDGDDFEFFAYDSTWNRSFSDDAAPTGIWTYLAGTYDGQDLVLYVDGLPQSTPAVLSALSTSSDPVQLGHNATETDRTYTGLMDEVRISASLRSEAWIRAQHLSMTDAFIHYDRPETF